MSAKSICEFQDEVFKWSLNNFGNQPSWKPLLGIGEEIGELNHAYLKREQEIRTEESYQSEIEDALGDIFIYMCDFAAREDIDIESVIEKTWEKVSKRNWKKNKNLKKDE